MDRTNEAINLFKARYDFTPQELGFSVIDIYEEQKVFLYAVSEEVVKAYKTQQNIVRGMMSWYMWPMGVATLNLVLVVVRTRDFLHPLCVTSYIFYGVWGTLLIALTIKLEQTKRLIRLGDTVMFLSYDR